MLRRLRGRAGGCSERGFVHGGVSYDGCLEARRGQSAADHLQLVDACRKEYSDAMVKVEGRRIGVGEAEGQRALVGAPYCLEFPDGMGDMAALMGSMFDSADPFRLWGIKSKVRDGYFKVLAMDLHTMDPVDFEIAEDMMRVYLPQASCGNAIMRLLVNMQRHYDSRIACPQMD